MNFSRAFQSPLQPLHYFCTVNYIYYLFINTLLKRVHQSDSCLLQQSYARIENNKWQPPVNQHSVSIAFNKQSGFLCRVSADLVWWMPYAPMRSHSTERVIKHRKRICVLVTFFSASCCCSPKNDCLTLPWNIVWIQKNSVTLHIGDIKKVGQIISKKNKIFEFGYMDA